ncbi:MAG TPA: cell division protein FtsQ/DivIB [Rhodanobacteraceae bacterium]|nr:cell division protein FtsQ/DivIB [Rhodanobacteraceae bacterium]
MKSGLLLKLLAWGIALTLVLLPVVGVLNGWFAGDRWPVRKLDVHAEFDHVSAEQIRAAVRTELGQGFFAIDLDRVRDAVVRLPWVERAEARKRWPDTLELTVYEQQPYARWGADRLVNRNGQVFSVSGAQTLQGLPRLSGPDSRLNEVLAFYARELPRFAGDGLVLEAVALSGRGSWRLTMASGAVIEVGRESAERRLTRFLGVWPKLAAGHDGDPVYIDLRYENGFALRWAEPVAPTATPASNAGVPPDGKV